KGTDAVIDSLHKEEARKKTILRELGRLDQLTQIIALDAKSVTEDLWNRLKDIPTLLSRHVPHARQILRKLLNGHIMCEPVLDENGNQGYRFTAMGTFDRLLTGVKIANDSAIYSGGGHGS
ncbi:hypothetical protein, partial [Petrachloros mirabilis]